MYQVHPRCQLTLFQGASKVIGLKDRFDFCSFVKDAPGEFIIDVIAIVCRDTNNGDSEASWWAETSVDKSADKWESAFIYQQYHE